jgi:hypothetical protein
MLQQKPLRANSSCVAQMMRCGGNGEPIEDGPSVVLLEVLAKHNYIAPDGWQGCRELTEK